MAFATSGFSTVKTDKQPSVLSRFFSAMVDARMRQAERCVATHLLSFDERTLEELGYDRASLKKLSMGLRH